MSSVVLVDWLDFGLVAPRDSEDQHRLQWPDSAHKYSIQNIKYFSLSNGNLEYLIKITYNIIITDSSSKN